MKTKTGNGTGAGKKISIAVAALSAVLVLFFVLDLSWSGSRTLSLAEVWNALIGNGTWLTDNVVNRQNLPRVLTGIFVGAGLAVTGCVMQAVFRNPLATPYILGLSSGASLGAAIAVSIPLAVPLSLSQPVLAFGMCLLTTALVFSVSRFGGSSIRTETLILAGVAVSSLFSAVVSLLTYIAPSEEMGNIVFWTMGNLGNSGFSELAVIVPLVAAGTALMLSQSRNLNAMMIGDSHAMDLGVDVRKVRIGLLVVTSMVVAACVAFVGTIGFVGLVIPHILRMALGPDNRVIIPVSVIGGAAFVLICDWVSHSLSGYYGLIPIGIVTSLIGAPFFVYLLCRKKREVGW